MVSAKNGGELRLYPGRYRIFAAGAEIQPEGAEDVEFESGEGYLDIIASSNG